MEKLLLKSPNGKYEIEFSSNNEFLGFVVRPLDEKSTEGVFVLSIESSDNEDSAEIEAILRKCKE